MSNNNWLDAFCKKHGVEVVFSTDAYQIPKIKMTKGNRSITRKIILTHINSMDFIYNVKVKQLMREMVKDLERSN